MLRQVDGKWVSERTHEEDLAAFQADLERLSPEEKAALQLMLAEAQTQIVPAGGSVVEAVAELEYSKLPVPPMQYLDDPYYMGEVAKNMYPKLREDFIKIFSGGYEELIATGSIGFGKSFFGTMCLSYVLYQLSCLRNPAESYGLAAGSQLHCVNLSARKDTAQRVIFDGVADKLELSPYFKELGFERRKDSLKFPHNIVVVGGESTDSSVLGLSVIAAIVDETNFIKTSAAARRNASSLHHYGRAEMLYSSIKSRMQSRFMKAGQLPGLLMLLSSRQVPDDFTETRIRQSIDDPKIYVMDYALWDVKPDNYSKERFQVFVGSGGQKPKIMEPGEQIPLAEGERIVDIPVDFRKRFEENLTGSLRDLAGVSVVTVTNFLQNRETLFKAIDKTRTHPFSVEDWEPGTEGRFLWDKLVKKAPDGEFEPIHFPDAIRFVHIDPSVSGDATGLAMGCISGFRKVTRENDGKRFEEDAPTIWVDLVMRITPPQGGEIFLGDVRNLIYQLSERGFPISKVSMDSYQSIESLQQLRLKGYQTEIISVDAHLDPYQMLKGTMYEGRLSVYEFPVLINEMKNLQLDWVRKKVDHPNHGSKDVADAVCGLVYSLTQKYTKKGASSPFGATPMQGISELPKENTYVPVDSKSGKRGQILWNDEYEDALWDKKEVEDEGDDGTMPPFIVG